MPKPAEEIAAKYNTDPAKVARLLNLYIRHELAEAMTESDIIAEQRRKH